MSNFRNSCLTTLLLAGGLLGCRDGNAAVSPDGKGSGTGPSMSVQGAPVSTSTLLGRSTFQPDSKSGKIDMQRKTGDWSIDIKARPATDVAVQRIVFPVGASSGWHMHPGPVFIQVVYGTMTFYEADDPTCSPIIRTKGQGYLDLGLNGHMAVNQSSDSVVNVVTYFAPPGATLKIPMDAPAACAGLASTTTP